MSYLSPRYNGKVGVYRINEIERFGTSGTYSYSFVYENPLTSPYWFSRSTNLSSEFSTANSIWRIYGTSSSALQQNNVFGSSIVFNDGDIISVEVPGLDADNSTAGRRFVYHNFCWTLEPSAPTYITVFLSTATDGSNNGQISWVLNGSAVKGVTLAAGFSTSGLKFIWDKSTSLSYIYAGSPNFGYNTLIGTYSMPVSSMTFGATNSDPFFFTGLALSPTQSTSFRTSDNSTLGYNNGYIISSQQYNGLTGSNKDYYTSPGSARINIKY
jgi:hypothetical protein